jgi:hypothetical protein
MLDIPQYDGLFNTVVRRLRNADTIFGQNIKLVLRQLSDDQWALLTLPYLLVVPTVTRVQLRPADQDYDSIVNPRSITFIAQLDARGSEAEWMAANDIELVEKQLIAALVNWRPTVNFKPTGYAGMRVEAVKAPAVKCAFVFTFYEELVVEANIGDETCEELRAGCLQLNQVFVNLNACCPPVPTPPPCEADPCGPDPCNPCAPAPVWTGDNLKSAKQEEGHGRQYDREGPQWGNRL